MDALQVHAAAAAIAAGGAAFTDVAVGFEVAKGRSVRIFYAGERDMEQFTDRVLDAGLVGQGFIVRGAWPNADTGTNTQRTTEIEIAAFVKDFRTRVLADSQLGGEAKDLTLGLAQVEQVVLGGDKYTVADMEAVMSYDEFPLAP